MKKLFCSTPILMSGLFLLFPILWGIGSLIGYTFTLYNLPVIYTVLAILAVVLTVGAIKSNVSVNQTNEVFATLLLPIMAVSVLFFIFKWSGRRLLLLYIALLAIFCTVCASIVFFKYAKKLRGLSIIVTAVMSLGTALLLFILLVFGGISFQEVVKTIPSPQETYTVRVISDNQGALGGATIVEAVENGKDFSILIGKFEKRPQELYYGGWGEVETLDIRWEDDHTLLLDDTRHTLK